ERATPEAVAAIEHQYGLDQPITTQYWKLLQRSVALDFGASPPTRPPVTEELKRRFPATIELALAAMIFSVFFGIPLGFIAAKRYGTAVDHASLLASLLGISIPIFFLAILLK